MEAPAARGVRHEGVPRRHGVRDGADVHGGSGTDPGALPAKVTGGHLLDSHLHHPTLKRVASPILSVVFRLFFFRTIQG